MLIRSLYTHTFPIKVEYLEYCFFVCRLIQTNIPDFFKQCEVNDAGGIFLVMLHQFIQAVILFAVKSKGSVILLDKLNGLTHLFFREARLYMRKIKFTYYSPRYGITMEYRTVLCQGKALESMPYGMAEVKRLTYAMFLGVLLYNIFFYLNRTAYHCFESSIVYAFRIER